MEHELFDIEWTAYESPACELDQIDRELLEASIDLSRANQRYHEAILARIALRESEFRDER